VIGNTGLMLYAIVIGFTPINLGGSWDSEPATAASLFETHLAKPWRTSQ